LKPAIAATLLKMPACGVEFTSKDWLLCEKVVKVLSVFEEATKMLVGQDSCISSCIPIVTTITKSFASASKDDAVAKMKKSLKVAMEDCFLLLKTHYIIQLPLFLIQGTKTIFLI